MENTLLKIALIQAITALITASLVIYISTWLLKNRYLRRNKVEYDNLFFAFICSGVLIGVAILLSGVIPSITTALKIIQKGDVENFYVEALKFISVAISIILISSLIINILVTYLLSITFDKIKIDEELKKDKVAIAILFATFFICFCLIIKEPVTLLTEVFIPFEKLKYP